MGLYILAFLSGQPGANLGGGGTEAAPERVGHVGVVVEASLNRDPAKVIFTVCQLVDDESDAESDAIVGERSTSGSLEHAAEMEWRKTHGSGDLDQVEVVAKAPGKVLTGFVDDRPVMPGDFGKRGQVVRAYDEGQRLLFDLQGRGGASSDDAQQPTMPGGDRFGDRECSDPEPVPGIQQRRDHFNRELEVRVAVAIESGMGRAVFVPPDAKNRDRRVDHNVALRGPVNVDAGSGIAHAKSALQLRRHLSATGPDHTRRRSR
jgi:hypothetical protein